MFYFFNYKLGIPFRKEMKSAASYINQNCQTGDIVAHTSEHTYFPFLYYRNKRLEERLIVSNYQDILFIMTYAKILKKLRLNFVNLEEIKKNSYGRIWFVLSDRETEMYHNSEVIKEYFDRNYAMTECKEFLGITIYLYQII